MLNAFGVFAVFFPFLAVYGHEDNTLCGPIPEKASRAPFWANLTITDYTSRWITSVCRHQHDGEQRPGKTADCIKCLPQTVRRAALAFGHEVADKRIARGIA